MIDTSIDYSFNQRNPIKQKDEFIDSTEGKD